MLHVETPINGEFQPGFVLKERGAGSHAAKALDDANGDPEAAASLLEERARSMPELREALLDPLIAFACGEAVSHVLRARRKASWDSAGKTDRKAAQAEAEEKATSRIRAYANHMLMNMDVPFIGKRLGDCRAGELMEPAERCLSMGRNLVHKGHFLNRVMAALPKGKTVGKALSEDHLQKIHSETQAIP